MTDDQSTDQRSGSTRRTVLKTGSAALAAAGLSATGLGSVTAQDDGGLFVEDESSKGLMFENDFQPSGLFTIASPVIDYDPNVEEVEDELFDQYNMRTIRYIQPDTRNVPFFPQQDAPIGPYEEEFGFVVDDEFVADEDDVGDFQDVDDDPDLLLDDQPIEEGGLDNDELRRLRPTIFALEQTGSFFGGSERMVTVRFSPIPEDQEEGIFEENRENIFGTDNPFQPAPGGALDGGNQTGNATGNATGNESGGNSSDLL